MGNVGCLYFLLPSKCLLLLGPTLIFLSDLHVSTAWGSLGFDPGEGAKLLQVQPYKTKVLITAARGDDDDVTISAWPANDNYFH